MSFFLDFTDDGHIFHWKINDPWTVADVIGSFKIVTSHMEQVSFRVHGLIDMRQVRTVPENFLQIRSPYFSHPRRGHIAIIGANPLIRTFVIAMFRLENYQDYHFYNDEYNAYYFLKSIA